MFCITGFVISLEPPTWVKTVMINLCAWISTFIIIALYRKFYPGVTVKQYFKMHFGARLKWQPFVGAFLIQLVIILVASFFVFQNKKMEFAGLTCIPLSTILLQMVSHIFGGATGEELGWQGFALNKLQKYYSPIKATFIDSFLWGIWHFPILLISGYAGLKLVTYIVVFLLALMAFSVFSNYFYNKTKTIFISMWMHFLFNLFFGIASLVLGIDALNLLIPVCVGYCIVAVIILLKLKGKKSASEIV